MAYAHTDQGGIALRLNDEEATFMRAVMNKVAGNPSLLRGHADDIDAALAEAGATRRRLSRFSSDPELQELANRHGGVWADKYED